MIETTRRAILAGSAGVGAAAALAACGGGGTSDKGSTGSTSTGALAKTGDIPVGGGKVFAKQEIVVTQPTAGQFKAFTAICTHLGCTVGSVSNGTINCPCHGSMYSITDGSVKGGPAPRPLAEKKVTVSGTNITVSG